jgi:predicted DNA-binding protein
MVRPWVKVSLSQYEKLNRLKKETGIPLSEIIRKAVSQFVRKKGFPVSTTALYLSKGTRDKYKTVSVYFHRSDWILLAEISKNTGECKTELIRQAVDEYLGKQV